MAFDKYLGLHASALRLHEQRQTVLANNLANVDTPNYKARDFDFKDALKQAVGGNAAASMVTDNPAHINGLNAAFSPQMKFVQPSQVSLDGNTVDKNQQIVAMKEEYTGYNASFTFLNNKITTMMAMLRGE